MDNRFANILLAFIAAAALCAVGLLGYRFYSSRTVPVDPATVELTDGEDETESEEAADVSGATDPESASGPARTDRMTSAKTREERDKEKFDVAEMRNGAEDMIRRFRGTPEERQEVIEECEAGKQLILAIMDMTVQDYDSMSPDELREAREDFEKEFRAQLDYLQTGRLHRMLKTPEEQEIIGSTFDVVQQFLETIDNGLRAAGY